ncbi:hypothetical protein DKX38_016693 [Salix brachista]|uniref:phosphoglycerate dehydrogenase n=1 Tax=Salix brachista TaxID=2182728 RepID=A0A5N5L956_9ROSI|nr:hypothetical protein DKX38_016693 [Salix brachista]
MASPATKPVFTLPFIATSSSSSQPSARYSRLPFRRSTTSTPVSLKRFRSYTSTPSHPSLSIKNATKTIESAETSSVLSSVGGTNTSSDQETKPTILVSEKLGEAGLELLRNFGDVDCSYDLSQEDLCKKIASCDALIVRSGTKVTRQVFEAAKGKLKVVGRAGVGIDNVDLQAATEFGCLVVNAPTANTVAAAEHGIALLASMARNVAQADASMKDGQWQRNKYVGVSLVGKTLAVMGFGKVGSEVARRAKGLGMQVIAHDPYAPADRARAIGIELVPFDQAISTADFISLHMPLTPATEKVFNDDTFEKMKKGARIVNVARGGVIDEDALLRALDSEKVAQAALDVFAEEPPPKDSKLVQHERVTVTPHLGASTKEAQEGVAIEIAEAVVGALKGELAATAANAPMVPPEVLSELAPYAVLAEKLGRLAVQLVAGGSGIKSRRWFILVYQPCQCRLHSQEERPPHQRGTRGCRRAPWAPGSLDPGTAIQCGFKIWKRCFRWRHKHRGWSETRCPPFDTGRIIQRRREPGRNLVLCRQVDRPGMIGQVGNILGEQNVNVSFMSVGRTAGRRNAIMAIGVDEEPNLESLEKSVKYLPSKSLCSSSYREM